MKTPIQIDAQWDDDAHVWIATSADAPGLVVEAESWQAMIGEVRAVLPELLSLNKMAGGDLAENYKVAAYRH